VKERKIIYQIKTVPIMKNLKVIFSTFLVIVFAISVMLFTTCEKEIIEPTPIEGVINDNLNSNIDKVTLSDPDLVPKGEFSIPIEVTSKLSKCGYTLTVSSPEADLSDGQYTVNWYKKPDRKVFFVGESLACVCGFPVRVEVIDDSDNLAANKFLDIPGC
jgi:hypothetical protein